MSKETDARIIIDELLRKAGWNPADKSEVETEKMVNILPQGRGFVDYVLLDQRGRSLAVIEAKKKAIEPYTAKQQALPYAQSLNAPFIFLTNGEVIYFWDYQNDDARFQDAFKNRYLVPYKFATGITEIIDSGVELEEIYYDPSAFERKWTNETTNRLMMAEFDRLAHENYLELAPRQTIAPGKSIVFALTKNHAARLARYLNELHPECRGNYAAVITSDVANADDLIRQFQYEDYPQIAVSVDMLNTGFNCREVLHLVMCRPIRSPILYQQIRGRGTRTAPHIDKQMFVIYDFFRNHEYFNDSDTDIFTGTTKGRSSSGSSKAKSSSIPRELIELGISDRWLQAVTYVEVGTEGERVDKKDYVSNWEETIKNVVKDNLVLQKIRREELLTEEEENQLSQLLNQPRYYFNEENLRRAYNNQKSNLIDFIQAALGKIKIKTIEEQKEENFRAWLISKSFTTEQASYLSLLKNRAISQGKISIEDLFKPPLSVLNAAGLGLELFGEEGLKTIFEELNGSVFADDSTGTDG